MRMLGHGCTIPTQDSRIRRARILSTALAIAPVRACVLTLTDAVMVVRQVGVMTLRVVVGDSNSTRDEAPERGHLTCARSVERIGFIGYAGMYRLHVASIHDL